MGDLLAMESDPNGTDWKAKFAAIPIQHRGRVMPMDTFARHTILEITGRTDLTGEDHIELLAALLFNSADMYDKALIPIGRRSLKVHIGLDPEVQYFSASELMTNDRVHQTSGELQSKMLSIHAYRPTLDEKALMDAQRRISTIASFLTGEGLAIVPVEGSKALAIAGLSESDQHTEHVRIALLDLRRAYLSGVDLDASLDRFINATERHASHSPVVKDRIGLELFYNTHTPWKMGGIATIASLLLMTLRRLIDSKSVRWLTGLLIVMGVAWALAEQVLGIWLRITILGRAPVANTFEVLVWIGLIALVAGIIGQLTSPKSWFLGAGLGASALAIFFSMLVPMPDQTSPLTAVLRSNYWLTVHVLTIVSSYGVLLLASVLAHIYLLRATLKPPDGTDRGRLVEHIYRSLQIGVFLLGIGTVLGGIWAADSWGRFWGWDPKETWSLISILFYIALIHARYAGWIHDIGLAVTAIVGFLAIIWTFYGVNYVLSIGLHSYGAGSGGEIWFAIWLIIEIVFLHICVARKTSRSMA